MEAVLRWAKALHAQDVPTMYALDKSRENLAKIIGNPTKKVVGSEGNIFYINDIAHAIAKVSLAHSNNEVGHLLTIRKDYANPLTRFAMKDFPESGEGGMSEVHHGRKMLLESPQGIATPAVRVRGRIFFVDELLRCVGGMYFIPERFFSQKHPRTKQSSNPAGGVEKTKLMALGRVARKAEVSWFSLKDENIRRLTICAEWV